MIKNFIVFSLSGILCLLLISCPMTDISSESGSSSSAKVVSQWVVTSYSTVTGDFTLFIYDDDSFSG